MKTIIGHLLFSLIGCAINVTGNLPIAQTGNTVTTSRLCMKKDHAETTVTDGPEKSIWPSFFKIAETASQQDNVLDRSKYTNTFAGRNTTQEAGGKYVSSLR